MTTLTLDSIRIDGGTQSRAALNDDTVADYAATIRDGTDFPPIVVFHDGKHYWLADGFHRWHAYRQAGASEIAADVRQGTKRDAQTFAMGANVGHGLRLSNADKRHKVELAFADEEWSGWSDRQIADLCGVSHTFVAKVRVDTGNVASMDRTFVHPKTGRPATMNTANIGKPADVPPEVKEEADRVRAEQKAERDRLQAENDAHREKARAALPESVKRAEEAKARNGSVHAAIAGTKPEDEDDLDAIRAERDELREENAALRQDVDDLKRRLTKYDDMAVQWEKGGFEAIRATDLERIRVLQRQVEDMSADRASAVKSRDYWRKQALDLGYVSPNEQIEAPELDAADLDEAF